MHFVCRYRSGSILCESYVVSVLGLIQGITAFSSALHFTPTKAWQLVNSQHFLVPQRRMRVWGLATLITSRPGEVCAEYGECLQSFQSNCTFTAESIFANQPKCAVKAGRHQHLVKLAKESAPDCNALFVNCNGSYSRPVYAEQVVPCVTPGHPVYATHLERYLGTSDFMNVQGFFESSWSSEIYQELLSKPSFTHDLVGNSFTTTVAQAVILTTFAVAADAWGTVSTRISQMEDDSTKQAGQTADVVLRRIRGKRKAGEYGPPRMGVIAGSTRRPKPAKKGKRVSGVRKYKRKKKGVDSRSFAKGKHESATLWQKEQLRLGVYIHRHSMSIHSMCKLCFRDLTFCTFDRTMQEYSLGVYIYIVILEIW